MDSDCVNVTVSPFFFNPKVTCEHHLRASSLSGFCFAAHADPACHGRVINYTCTLQCYPENDLHFKVYFGKLIFDNAFC